MAEPFVGDIRMFANFYVPRNYAYCNGQILMVNQYSSLYSLIGSTYGGDGINTFGLPNLQGRIPMHYGAGLGLTPRALSQMLGSEAVFLQDDNMPQHKHSIKAVSEAGDSDAGTNRYLAGNSLIYADSAQGAMADETFSNVGGSQAHENMMPFMCINFGIALNGAYPPRQ